VGPLGFHFRRNPPTKSNRVPVIMQNEFCGKNAASLPDVEEKNF
jgi:hypothetical protein